MATSDPDPPLPRLPVDLDDQVSLDNWYCTWNAWIAVEAGKRKWPWFKPMTPAMLHEIVESEKRRRAGGAAGRDNEEFTDAQNDRKHQRELTEARTALTELEYKLAAQDPAYQTKRTLLVPILRPILKDLPPARWAPTFQQAYDALCVPADSGQSSATKANNAKPVSSPESDSASHPEGEAKNDAASAPPFRPIEPLHAPEAAIRLTIVYSAYLLMAWILTRVLRNLAFGTALLYALVGIALFLIIGWAADELYWRLAGKSNDVDVAIRFFQHNCFPTARTFAHDDIGNYLYRIHDDGRMKPRLRIAAARMEENIRMHELFGMFSGMRRRAAVNKALDTYAPREKL